MCMCYINILIKIISMNPITGSEFSLLRESFLSFRAEVSKNVGTYMVKASCSFNPKCELVSDL